MISKGKRKNLIQSLESRRWSGLTDQQKQDEVNSVMGAMMNTVAAHYQIPVHMLLGKSKENIQEEL